MQKYIEKPLLYNERKFDIRVWVLITQKLEIYMYKEGYIRTSSNKYTLSEFDSYIHLTNNCLQVHGDGYGIHEAGNTLSYEHMNEYYRKKFPDLNFSMEKHIIPRI
jgi:hypothetical protein